VNKRERALKILIVLLLGITITPCLGAAIDYSACLKYLNPPRVEGATSDPSVPFVELPFLIDKDGVIRPSNPSAKALKAGFIFTFTAKDGKGETS